MLDGYELSFWGDETLLRSVYYFALSSLLRAGYSCGGQGLLFIAVCGLSCTHVC